MKSNDPSAQQFPGQADPQSTLNLLWGNAAEPKRGPRPSLSAGAVGTAALALADEGGLAALSMRALGARLGVAAMALYRYVPSKDVLLELVLEAAYAELPDELPAGAGWPQRLRLVATKDRPCADFPDKDGEGKYPPEVVLDFDHWAAVPRRG